jgi:hypothetical protein
MSSGDPKKPPGRSSGKGGSREPPADALRTPFAPKIPSGRVQFDDRGNATWEWAVGSEALGREVSEDRLKKLENPELSIADDAPTPFDGVRPNPQGVVKGYNPYDSGKLGRNGAPPRKKKDLRKLSEWLRLKKQAEKNKHNDDDE